MLLKAGVRWQVSLLEPATLLLRRMPRLCLPSPAEPHVQAFDDPAAYLEQRQCPFLLTCLDAISRCQVAWCSALTASLSDECASQQGRGEL